jgi:mannitol/fructose-specific phosphotransferase system IIA component (Ntr-type)
MPHRVFNLDEVAAHLHVAVTDIQLLVKRGEIPVEKKGDRLLFRKKDIDGWASQRILGLSGKPLQEFHRKTSAGRSATQGEHAVLSELMKASFIAPAMRSKTKASVLRDMVDLADSTGLVLQKEELLKTILEREQISSTALSGGIALPHPHTHQPYMFERCFVVLGRTIQPIPFGAPDGRATDLFFMVCCQDDRLHLHVLARICTICEFPGALCSLREAETARDVYDALVDLELEVIRML